MPYCNLFRTCKFSIDLNDSATCTITLTFEYNIMSIKTFDTLFFHRFPLGESKDVVTVEKYFKDKYKIVLRYPGLPCLRFGEKEKHNYIPIEVVIYLTV